MFPPSREGRTFVDAAPSAAPATSLNHRCGARPLHLPRCRGVEQVMCGEKHCESCFDAKEEMMPEKCSAGDEASPGLARPRPASDIAAPITLAIPIPGFMPRSGSNRFCRLPFSGAEPSNFIPEPSEIESFILGLIHFR
jgi:hypothetical protein